MKKRFQVLIFALLVTFSCSFTVFAHDWENQSPVSLGAKTLFSYEVTWNSDGSQWTCTLNSTGELIKNTWMPVYEEDGQYSSRQWYYFDENGIMKTGWIQDGNYTLYIEPDGRLWQGEGLKTIDGYTYIFAHQHYIRKNETVTIDGKRYVVDESGHVVTSTVDKRLENVTLSSSDDQLTYLNTYRRQKGISDLTYDAELSRVAKRAYDYGEGINLSTVYSYAVDTGHNIRHVAYIRATAFDGGSYIYLTSEAVDAIQNTWFTRVGYYKSNGTIMVIMAAYDQEEASILSPEEVQGRWVADQDHYKYERLDGTYAVSCWLKHPGDGKWYHFDENGYMQTGWFQDGDGKWYFLSPETGEMMTNTTVDGYTLGADGARIEP